MRTIQPDLTYRFKPDDTRPFPFIADGLAFYAMTIATWAMRKNKFVHQYPNVVLSCRAGRMDLQIPISEFVDRLLTGQTPSEVQINTKSNQIDPKAKGKRVDGLSDINTRLSCALFSVFAEKASEWVKRNMGHDYPSWPPIMNFGRVVRNGIVHGGTINLQSPTSVAVSWRGVTYSHKDFGQPVIHNGRLSLGDLIVLMLEMDSELTDLGAPFDLG